MSLADCRTHSSLGTGDSIVVRLKDSRVVRIVAHGPGRVACLIRSDWFAVEVVTTNGTRWFGSETQPYIGSDLRMHWGPTEE